MACQPRDAPLQHSAAVGACAVRFLKGIQTQSCYAEQLCIRISFRSRHSTGRLYLSLAVHSLILSAAPGCPCARRL